MGTTIYPTVPVAQPAAEPWPPLSDNGDEHTIRIDEMFARQLDNEFSAGVRGLLHHPETGVAAQSGEAALEAIAGALPALNDLKERTLSQAIGPRQRNILEPLIETRLDWAAGTLGQLAQRATVEVDDASVADRIAGLKQDAAAAWQDPAYLRRLGRTAVEELRYQGERRGWDPSETDTRVRAGLSDLYAGAIETAIGQDDLDGGAGLYDHARVVIDPDRQAALDRRFVRAREVALYRDVDRDMAGIPLEPVGPPGAEIFAERAAELTPDDASDEVRAGIAQVAAFAQRRAERQWQRQQAEAGVAALDWLGKNPGRSLLAIPPDLRDWLAPDQWHGLEALFIEGRLRTDGDLFERLDQLLVYEPDSFAALDLDRHRLSLDDEDHARFAGTQKAIAEGRVDPGHVRYDWLRRGIDRALEAQGIDTDSSEAVKVRADARDRLQAFSSVEGREPGINDIERMVIQEVDGARHDRNVTDQTTDATQPTPNVVDAQVTDWLMDIGSDGKPQAKRPPLDVWNRLTPAQQEAVDFLLAQNARSSQAEAPPEKQLVSDPPAAANENTRNYVCTQAVYSCLSNAPSDAPPTWRHACLGAESLCNRFVNQSRVSPFNRTIILNFPDHSRVIVPQGKQGGAFHPARPAPDR
ncbi:MAG: hypothetical protein Q8K93_30505 [Reyranella sp.]|uniref:hypothetical protein n=1 Tax=Reyranella sp. TaxID=1929291 RepID=UPI00272F9FE2|nr:hypothetical protein [Reyranella sp.]MDP1966524.1 hypothetical protein [Reyranella sp.]MDP2373637.1 hypothetical protein [Reyranella sp.]